MKKKNILSENMIRFKTKNLNNRHLNKLNEQSWWEDAWNATTDAASAAWDATTDAASSAWDATTDVASAAWDATTDFAESVWDATTGALSKAWDAMTESEITHTLAEIIGTAVAKASIIGHLIKFCQWAFGGVRLRIVFPANDWEATANDILQNMGIISGHFKTYQEGVDYLKEFAATGVLVDELVFGSHGDGKRLIMPQEGASTFTDTYVPAELMAEAKKIIKSDTIVFFTACYGGTKILATACKIADALNHNIYIAHGIYNYLTNTSGESAWDNEKGYYLIKPGYTAAIKSGKVSADNQDIIDKGFAKHQTNAPVNLLY
jgi:hypothetical protein